MKDCFHLISIYIFVGEFFSYLKQHNSDFFIILDCIEKTRTMSCYDCIHGPVPCERWEVEGHTMLCQESIDYTANSTPAPPAPVDTKEIIELAEKQVSEMFGESHNQ